MFHLHITIPVATKLGRVPMYNKEPPSIKILIFLIQFVDLERKHLSRHRLLVEEIKWKEIGFKEILK